MASNGLLRRGASRALACVLAGGASRRFGSPKALLRVNGRPIIDHIFDRVARTAAATNRLPWKRWVSVSSALASPPSLSAEPTACESRLSVAAFDRVVVDDQLHAGPLEAMTRVLRAARPEDLVLFLAVDMPEIDGLVVDRLLNALRHPPSRACRSGASLQGGTAVGVMGRWGCGPRAGRVEPMPSLWRAGPAMRLLGKAKASGVAAPTWLARQTSVRTIPLRDRIDRGVISRFSSRQDLDQIAAVTGWHIA